MLPLTLIYLLSQILGGNAQQTSFQLPLNKLANFTGNTLPNPPVLSIPSPQIGNLTVTVALCAPGPQTPRFILSNDSSITQPGISDLGDGNVFELSLTDGFGNWTGPVPNGGFMSVLNAGRMPFEVAVSDDGPMHEQMENEYPFLGDTTSNQALLFSPAFSRPDPIHPTYPNYTLPPANLSFPTGPSSPANWTLIILPTSSSSLNSFPRTACALSGVRARDVLHVGATQSEGLWLKDENGWRWQWIIDGLTPATNYTVFAMQDSKKVSSPINFVTKSAAFACPIVHSLPFCPSISYAVPIQGPSTGTIHDSSTLPDSVTQPLIEVLTNFTVSLTTFPCGRDQYSPLVGCADCQQAYRRWLCTVFFPRCSEASPDSGNSAQKPVSALQAMEPSATPRSPSLPPFSSAYNALLPCLETCTAVDRACPISMGFKCPVPRFTASSSYGVGYVDTGEEDEEGGGSTGAAQDRWGNVWCNLG